MPRNFRSVNKKSVQLDVFYGWDVDVKQWFIDIKMSGFTGGNLVQWFNSESNYKKVLKNFLINGRMQEYVNNIPLHIINDDLVSLKGCATYQE